MATFCRYFLYSLFNAVTLRKHNKNWSMVDLNRVMGEVLHVGYTRVDLPYQSGVNRI